MPYKYEPVPGIVHFSPHESAPDKVLGRNSLTRQHAHANANDSLNLLWKLSHVSLSLIVFQFCVTLDRFPVRPPTPSPKNNVDSGGVRAERAHKMIMLHTRRLWPWLSQDGGSHLLPSQFYCLDSCSAACFPMKHRSPLLRLCWPSRLHPPPLLSLAPLLSRNFRCQTHTL